MDKVFIQGLVQLQCKRFREREEERERGIEGGRSEEGEEKKGKGRPTQLFCSVTSLQTQSSTVREVQSG